MGRWRSTTRRRQSFGRAQALSEPSRSGRQAVTSPWWAARPKAGRRRILLDDASEAAEAEGQDGEIERRGPASDPSTGKGLTPHPSGGGVGLVILCDLAFKG